MNKLTKTDLRAFLSLLMFSLIGNACADFALVWYGLSKIESAQAHSSNYLSSFYIGQAIGVILIAPVFAVFLDRYRQRISSIMLDLAYAFILILLMLCDRVGLLLPSVIFIAVTMTAAISTLHKSTIAYAAIDRLGETVDKDAVNSQYTATINLTYLFGWAVSGIVFHRWGVKACLLVGVLSFIPMPLTYFRLFPADLKGFGSAQTGKSWFLNFKEGFKVISSDTTLLGVAVSVAILNAAASVFPAVVGYAFERRYPQRSDLGGMAIGVAIFLGTLTVGYMTRLYRRLPANLMIPLSVLPALLCLSVCVQYPSPYLYALAFLLSCCGSNLRNTSSNALRLARIPKASRSRGNTVYMAFLNMGQVAGGALVIPILKADIRAGGLALMASFIIAGIFSWLRLPEQRLGILTEPTK